ncbi:MAG: alpha/beta hydrolase [Acidimicrobiales bacterium]
MSSRRRVTVLAIVIAAGLFTSACIERDVALERAGDTLPPPTTTGPLPDSPSSTTTEPVAPVAWEDCGSAQCATVAMPIDHDVADGGTIDVFVRRRPATGDRVGALFLNFGGPGTGASSLIDALPIPDAVTERFDIVGMDPRGVGRSTPLACGVDPATLYAVDPTIDDDADARRLIEISEQYADDCARRHGDLLTHVGTRDVARDMDRLRAGMGDEQLSYLGFSYGTSIGQAYADQYPDRVRTMVLDGLVDPAPAGIDVAVEQALGFETALANWAAGCTGRSSCRFGGGAIRAAEQVLAGSETGIDSSAGTRQLGPGEAAVALAYPLYRPSSWSALDRALADALDGDGRRMVDLADAYADLVDFSIYFAVSCLDSSWPRSPATFLERAEAAGERAPRFGEAIVNDYVRCALWPVEAEPLGAITAPGAPPIIVVSTTGDPATPYESGVRVAERLESGVLLTHEGEGHTIVFQGNACVDALVVSYLVDVVVPANGASC